MEDDDWSEDCAPRRVMEIFATKWTSMILHTLHARHSGAARSGALHRSLPGLSKKMFVQTLRDMETSGLIERRVDSTVPPAVTYTLTPLGLRFVGLVDMVYHWGRDNADALDDLQPRLGARRGRGAQAAGPAG
ncbi:winged helix-turn-helix transcriptional regulator [Roseicitreum antarcticum]|uniref:Transcriptional regulator, HxlR family n=1 Tax=Roseicitreum antarcticum TaxID=564137 RepID=A0A1H2TBJ5_9RHOB|nr:helix-turn-helix domain-containing protein [Roseicitreum antarcticum]SDW41262.1 transcriptional regulator, HxlR family [Roseicitreum antarcticum]